MSACKLGALLAPDGDMDADDRVTLGRVTFAPEVPATTLSAALHRLGTPVSATTIKDHRASRCACRKDAR